MDINFNTVCKYIDESKSNYDNIIIVFNDLTVKLNDRMGKLEKQVELGTDYILDEFEKSTGDKGEKIVKKVATKTVPKKTAKKETVKKEVPKIEKEETTPKIEEEKIEEKEATPKTEEKEEEKEEEKKEEKKKFEKLVDFFVYDFPLNISLYREFIPKKVSLSLATEEIYKKTAVKSNPKLNEFAAFARKRKDEYNNF